MKKRRQREGRLIGVPNMGNSCYIGSVLQGLFRVSGFRQAVEAEETGKKSPICGILKSAFEALESGDVGEAGEAVVELRRVVGGGRFEGVEQQDADEFLAALLADLGEETGRKGEEAKEKGETKGGKGTKGKKSKKGGKEEEGTKGEGDQGPKTMEEVLIGLSEWRERRGNEGVAKEFEGEQMTELSCESCGARTCSLQPFGGLPVEPGGGEYVESRGGKSKKVKSKGGKSKEGKGGVRVSLPDLASFHFSEEAIEDFRCEGCGSLGSVVKQQKILRFPRALLVTIKRFRAFPEPHKLDSAVEFDPQGLDLSDFRVSPKDKNLRKIVDPCGGKYKLAAVVEHFGSLDNGHYICRANDSQKGWTLFDDHRVSGFGEKQLESSQKSVYILFYEIEED